MRRTLAVLLGAALAASETRAAETVPPLVRSVEISITNVDVVVTDAKGRPVTDLTPLDFILTQEGKKQTISNFSFVRNTNTPAVPAAEPAPLEPSPAASPAPAPPPGPAGAHLVVFLDFLHLTAPNRNRAVASLAEFLPRTVGPRVEVQVVSFDHALRPRGPFTNDGKVISAVLEGLKGETTLGDAPARERSGLFSQIDSALGADPRMRPPLVDQAISALRLWCDRQAHDVDATLDAARSTAATLSGVEGRKILILVTEKLPPSPGRDIWDYFLRGLDRISRGSRGNADITDMSWKDFDRSPSFGRLSSASNGSGVSLFVVDAGGLTGDTALSAEFLGTDVSVNGGLATLDAESALRLLADETGGAAIVGRNNLALALESLEPAWTSYYSLGFESNSSKPGVPQSIRVSVNRPGVRVLTRRNVVERTAEQKIADAVMSGVHFPKTRNPLRASLHVGTPAKEGKLWIVPLEFKIPFDMLTLVPEAGRARGHILFTSASASADGQLSDVASERVPIDVPEAQLASLSGKTFAYTARLRLRGGAQTLSLALTDEISRTTSYVQPQVFVGDKKSTER
ncbi:MAG TPA: VWA domain-containing protein [Thermoanaerobaculia bacterium]